MTTAEVIQVLETLAEGIDPVTRQKLAADSACHHPYVIRALFHAAKELERVNRRALQKAAPAKAGSAWSSEEDHQLQTEITAGRGLREIAKLHARSRGAILARLVRLGYFETRDAARASFEGGEHPPTAWEIMKKERPRAGKVWSSAEDDLLLQELDAGHDVDQIARRLGRGVFSVQVRMAKLGRESIEDQQLK